MAVFTQLLEYIFQISFMVLQCVAEYEYIIEIDMDLNA